MKTKFKPMTVVGFIVTWIVIVTSLGGMLMGASASGTNGGYCKLNKNHGWHVVHRGGGNQGDEHDKEKKEKNDHDGGPWWMSKESCEDSLHPHPTKTPSVTAVTPGTTPTSVSTTPAPTDNPGVTATPSSTTPTPTDLPGTTETPEIGTPVPTETIIPIVTTPVGVIGKKGLTCQDAWSLINGNKFKEVGYRYFDNADHAWCKVWLLNTYGIDYRIYKLQNPLP